MTFNTINNVGSTLNIFIHIKIIFINQLHGVSKPNWEKKKTKKRENRRMASIIHPPQALKLKDCSDANQSWKTFKQAWELYEIASGTAEKSAAVRLATFLHVAGTDAIEKYNSYHWENEEDKKDLNKVIDKLESDCKSSVNILTERYKFYQRSQKQEETYDQYVTQLRILSTSCKFSNNNEALRDQFVFNIHDNVARQKIVEQAQTNPENLTFERAVTIVKSYEVTKMNKAKNEESLFKFQKNRSQNKDYSCRKCGYTHGPRSCPAFGKKCLTCQGMNHFSKVCKSKISNKRLHVIEEDDTIERTEESDEVNEYQFI